MNYLQGVIEKMRGITSRCTLKKSYEWKSKHLYVWLKNKDNLNISTSQRNMKFYIEFKSTTDLSCPNF